MNAPHFLVRLRPVLAVLAAIWLVMAGPAMAAGGKVALIIGNSTYANGGNLPNPKNDARLVAQAARAAGFEVTQLADQGRVGFQMALREFRARADSAEVAMVYYAGHGIDNNGENWLIPIDVTLADPRDLQFEAIPISQVLDSVAGAKLRVILLDACRNSPFADKWTSLTRTIQCGLSRIDASEGSLVIFAADPGATVLDDGVGGNSRFAKAVAARLPEPGLPLQKLRNVVYDDVRLASGGVQRPFPSQRLSGVDYYLVPKPADPVVSIDADDAAFLKAQQANTAEAFLDYLSKYPNGKSSPIATALYSALTRASAIRPPTAAAPVAAQAVLPPSSPTPPASTLAPPQMVAQRPGPVLPPGPTPRLDVRPTTRAPQPAPVSPPPRVIITRVDPVPAPAAAPKPVAGPAPPTMQSVPAPATAPVQVVQRPAASPVYGPVAQPVPASAQPPAPAQVAPKPVVAPVYGPASPPPAPPPAPIVPVVSVKPPIAPGPPGPAPMPVASDEVEYFPVRPIVRQWENDNGTGFPFMPEPQPFITGPYPTCRDNWLSVVDPVAKVQATNACKRAFSAYKINWLNRYREAMNTYAATLGEIYTKEVAPNFLSRENERQAFHREMTRRVEGVRDGGYLMADYERVIAQYEQDFKTVVDSYNRSSGCSGYPTPAGLGPNSNC